MSRYITRPPVQTAPRGDDDGWWDRGPMLPSLSVDGPVEIDTKLVDRFGNQIMRVQPPIGFGRDGEW